MADNAGLLGTAKPRPTNKFRYLLAGAAVATVVVVIVIVVAVTSGGGSDDNPVDPPPHPEQDAADAIIDRINMDPTGYNRLGYLCDTFGHRLSGSDSLEAAIDWMRDTLESDGFDNVEKEEVQVPHWVRGQESLVMTLPYSRPMNDILCLGGSIPTPEGGITAEVLVVSSFEELRERGNETIGKIVVWDAPWTTYGETVLYRRDGAIEAARLGAVASLTRSVTEYSLQTPHTGNMRYDEDVTQIPAGAITVEDSMFFHRLQDRNLTLEVTLIMESQQLPDATSYNVMGEIVGRELPNEIVVIGGHIDSWDVGQGAQDDGGGVLAAWEALRIMKALNLAPKRTIRVVAWTNEENGVNGGRVYFENRIDKMEDVQIAIEMDAGTFSPEGFGFHGSEEARGMFTDFSRLLQRIDATHVQEGGGGTVDIQFMIDHGVPGAGLIVGGDYFNYHHTTADTFDKIDIQDFKDCTAAMAVMAWAAAEGEKIPNTIEP